MCRTVSLLYLVRVNSSGPGAAVWVGYIFPHELLHPAEERKRSSPSFTLLLPSASLLILVHPAAPPTLLPV